MVGIGLMMGKSSTQLADFIRRTAELVAIIVSWLVFRVTHNAELEDDTKKAKLERLANICVGIAMCLSGVAMLLVTLLASNTQKGNVIPGLVIAVLGVTTNTWFWLRYSKLNKADPDAILAVQSKLYRAKSLVDACVVLALASILINPDGQVAVVMDVAGSVVVSLYLLFTGAKTLYGQLGGQREVQLSAQPDSRHSGQADEQRDDQHRGQRDSRTDDQRTSQRDDQHDSRRRKNSEG